MKALKSLFFWICLGIIALAVGFYFTAPLMGFEDTTQNLLISIIVGVAGILISVIVKMKSHFKAIQKKQPKKNNAEWELSWQKPLADETKEILKRIREVYKKTGVTLESTKFFLVLGYKGTGKSSLVRESGHHMRYMFPSAQDKQKRKKIFFNWSVSDKGVYIEVPPEFLAVGDSVSQELLFLLELLKDEPKKKPIDAIIVTENIEAISGDLDSKVRADVIRKSIEGTMAQLQLELPVYLALTHVDEMPGAKLYCDAHDATFLKNSFGIALSHKESESARTIFDERYTELMNTLYDNQLFSIFTQQQKGIQPIETYAFVKGLEENRSIFGDYIEVLCKKGLRKEISYFRGIYFTGIQPNEDTPTQSSAPAADPFAGAAFFEDDTGSSQVTGAPEAAIPETTNIANRMSYFASAFLAWVEGEKSLARFPRYRQSSMSRSAAIISFLMVIGAAGVAGYGIYGFTLGKVLLNRWEDKVEDARRMKWNAPKTIIREFPKFNGLREAIVDVEENRSVKIAPGFYRDAEVLPKAEKKHIVLSHNLTRNCVKRLEKDIRSNLNAGVSDSQRNEVYKDFKLYISLTNAGQEHYDKMNVDSLGAGIARLWYKFLELTPYTASQLVKETLPLNARLYAQNIVDNKVESVSKLYISNPALIKKARIALAGDSEVEAIYQAMLNQANNAPALKITDMGISDNSLLVNSSEIPAGFTKAVFDSSISTFFSKTNSAQGDWVLGKDKEKSTVNKALEKKVMQKYYRDYAFTWRQFINNITVKRHTDLQRLSGQLTELASASQDETLLGLRAFIEYVSINTSLVKDFSGAKSLANKVSSPNKKLNNKAKILRRYQDDIPESMLSPEERLAKKFSGFSVLTQQIRAKKFDDYFDDLIETAKFLIETSGTPERATEFLQKLFKGDRKNPINHAYGAAQEYIDQVPARQQDMLEHTLQLLTREVVHTVIAFAAQGIEADYEKQVVQNYQSYLQEAFPFNKEATDKQVSMDDLRFFFGGKSGSFTLFLNKIYDFVSLKSDECVVKNWKGIEMPFSSRALQGIHKAYRLSQALFHPNVDKLRQYQLKFTFEGNRRADLTVNFGKTQHEIKRGQEQKRFSLKWPDALINETGITVVTVDDTYSKSYKGEWGLLNLVKEYGEVKSQSSMDIYWPIKAKSYYINVNGALSVDRKFNPINDKTFFNLQISDVLVEERVDSEEDDD